MWLDRQEVYLAWVGMITAFTLALAFLGVSAWLISTGHEVSGTILGTVDLVALTTVFITRRVAGDGNTHAAKPTLEGGATDSPALGMGVQAPATNPSSAVAPQTREPSRPTR
jgi:hypothetical protein